MSPVTVGKNVRNYFKDFLLAREIERKNAFHTVWEPALYLFFAAVHGLVPAGKCPAKSVVTGQGLLYCLTSPVGMPLWGEGGGGVLINRLGGWGGGVF